jgi:hypothetical protein
MIIDQTGDNRARISAPVDNQQQGWPVLAGASQLFGPGGFQLRLTMTISRSASASS